MRAKRASPSEGLKPFLEHQSSKSNRKAADLLRLCALPLESWPQTHPVRKHGNQRPCWGGLLSSLKSLSCCSGI